MLVALAACCAAGCQHGSSLLASLHRAAARAAVRRGDDLLYHGHTDQAVRAYRQAIASDGRNADAHARLGRIRLAEGDTHRAAEQFAGAVRSAPENAAYALSLANARYEAAFTAMDRSAAIGAAARAYRHAASLTPQNVAAFIGLAQCYEQLGDLDAAVHVLAAAREVDENEPTVYTRLGAIHSARLDYERSLKEDETAVRLDPDDPAAHVGCGTVSLALSERHPDNEMYRERAIAHLRRSLELDPEQPRVRAMLEGFAPPQLRAVSVAGEPDD